MMGKASAWYPNPWDICASPTPQVANRPSATPKRTVTTAPCGHWPRFWSTASSTAVGHYCHCYEQGPWWHLADGVLGATHASWQMSRHVRAAIPRLAARTRGLARDSQTV